MIQKKFPTLIEVFLRNILIYSNSLPGAEITQKNLIMAPGKRCGSGSATLLQ
jgi:hypothetical protein